MTTIYLIAPILLIYFILSVVDYKKAFHIYVVLFPFLNDAISVSFNANLPLITGRRILLVILIFAYLINYIRIKKLRDRFKSNSLNKDLIVVSILLFLVTIANYSNRGGIVSFISILVEQFLVIGIIWSIYTRKEEIGKLIVNMVFSFGIIAIYSIYVQISGYEPNVNSALESLKNNVAACTLKYDFCTTLIGSAQDLQKANKDLSEKGDCLTLY